MEMIDTLYQFAKFQFECGNYSGSAECLYIVRVLVGILFVFFEFLMYCVALH